MSCARWFFAFAAISVLAVPRPAAAAAELGPGGTFADDDRSVHEANIEAVAELGITRGCHDEYPIFCPDEPVTRGQMAAFLVRAFGLPSSDVDRFADDEASIFQSEINALAAAGITFGCNPPDGDEYCPGAPVRRGEMAAFLSRSLHLADLYPEPESRFDDTGDSRFITDIARLADAAVTLGCNPPDNTIFCPDEPVTRGQMASFLARALRLTPIEPPPRPPTELVSSFTTYHKCCEARVTNIHVMADAMDGAMVWPGQEFSLNDYLGRRTTSRGYVPAPILLNGESYCCDSPLNIGGGTSQFGTTFYNAIFRGGYEIVDHRPHSRYIDRYPLGIEATLGYPSPDVVFVNDTVNPIRIDTSYTATSITVKFYGNDGGRDVDWTVTPTGGITYDSGGYVRVTRTITESNGDERTQTWGWSYQGS